MDRQDLPASLQKNPGLSRLFDKLEPGPILATATASHNTAAGQAVQVNGHVANHIQYLVQLSIHTDCGCSTFNPQHPHQTFPMTSSGKSKARAVQDRTKIPSRDMESQPACRLTNIRAGESATPMTIHAKNARIDAQSDTILVTAAPKVQGNWIAARVVHRFGLKFSQDKIHRTVPLRSPNSTDKDMKTRLYIDLDCGSMDSQGQASPCRHRFFIVNHLVYDVLLEATDTRKEASGGC